MGLLIMECEGDTLTLSVVNSEFQPEDTVGVYLSSPFRGWVVKRNIKENSLVFNPDLQDADLGEDVRCRAMYPLLTVFKPVYEKHFCGKPND
jgi:hypothetical protein